MMRKSRYSTPPLVALCLLFAGATARSDDSPSNSDSTLRVVGYLPDYRVDQIDPAVGQHLTDLILFSVIPERNGHFVSKTLFSPKTAALLKRFRDEQQLKIHLCVGGWERSKGFAEIAASADSRRQFASGLTTFCREHGLAGADIDWEHPKDQAEAKNYGLLLAEIKRAFQPHDLRLTAAMAAWQTLTPDGIEAVDEIHLMSYDAEGKHSTLESAQADVRKLREAGVPTAKICLGLPFYGRGIRQSSQVKTYAEIAAANPQSIDKDEVNDVYFNGPSTIRAKIRLAKEQNLQGVMIWEIGQDATGEASLLQVIAKAVKSTKR